MSVPVDRTKINGVEVVARQTATQITPLAEGPVALTGVDECLLADGSTAYQCVMAPDTCAEAYEKATSARAHLVKHSAKRQLKRQQASRARQGNGVKSVETRATRTAAVTGEAGTEFLTQLADQLETAVPLLRYMAKARTEPTLPEDELAELRLKAAKWDQAQNLFGNGRSR